MGRFKTLMVLTALAPVLVLGAAPKRTANLAAAANLKGALDALVSTYEAAHPDVELRVTYGSSGSFFAQLRNGAPFDLFLAADTSYPAKLAEAGLTTGAPKVYAVGALVLWVPAGSALPLEQQGLAALTSATVKKVAIGNPTVSPYGAAAEEALKAAGVREKLEGKLVLGESIAQAAQFAQSGNAQAALIPRALAIAPPLDQGRSYAVPPGSYPRLEQAAVVLKAAKAQDLATDFLRFILASEGQAILLKHGYSRPE